MKNGDNDSVIFKYNDVSSPIGRVVSSSGVKITIQLNDSYIQKLLDNGILKIDPGYIKNKDGTMEIIEAEK
jgi:hypothetical protein